jgi:tRNA threonylcarbamoyl adenosine modification protein YeaZ
MKSVTRPVLLLDHAGRACSVSVVDPTGRVLAERIQREPQRQAEDLALMVKDSLQEAGLQVRDLAAIACQRGPGSYTGLRIGAALAQGLALPYDLPLVGVCTLESMVYAHAMQAGLQPLGTSEGPTYWVPMIDARRDEVYTGQYSVEVKENQFFPRLQVWQEAHPCVLDDKFLIKFQNKKVCFVGDGVAKWHNSILNNGYLDKWKLANFVFDFDIVSSMWYGLVSNSLESGEYKAPSRLVVDYRKSFFGTTFGSLT